MERAPLSYLADLCYGATQHPCGLIRPKVVLGHFTRDENGRHQELFFRELQQQGFRRTIWQLIFPGQTAGLIKRIPPRPDGANEHHVRFYDDGIITCETEVDRFSSLHWAGPRRDGIEILTGILNQAVTITVSDTREKIRRLFGTKNYSESCTR